MKKLLFVLLILISVQNVFSQSPYRKKVIHKATKNLVEEYDTKDSTSTIKIGYYARYNHQTAKLIKTGSFANNQRTGVWTFYDDSSKVSFKYNYTTGMVLFSKPDTLSKYFLKLAGVDTNFYAALSQAPVFIGGAIEYNDFIAANLRYPTIAKENNIKGNVIVSFNLRETGYPENPKIIKGLGYGCDDEVLRVIKLLPRFIPARRQQEISHTYYMAFKFEPKK